ncbi:MAG: adenylate/guanylate cyclase domain-containing protein [Acidimicrobiia bacterium]
MTNSEKWSTLLRILAVMVPIGMAIGLVLGWILGGIGVSLVAGALIGFLITGGIVGFDVSWELGLIPRGWREAPFVVVIVSRSLVWLAIIVLGISLPLITVAGLSWDEVVDQTFAISVALSFLAALLFNFIGQVNRLLGRRVLVRLIVGRYHRPREEDRVFLLIDLRDSTQIAERLGNIRYHAFLKRFISDVTATVSRYRGEVHRYVGDEVIFTWIAAEGLHDARCVEMVFAVSDTLDAAQAEYEEDFGVMPTFWAGLHLGPVVAGEIGTIKHEIAFLGDTLNAAARIEQACKEYQHQFLASEPVISAVELPDGVAAESLGMVDLRGLQESLELFAVTRRTSSKGGQQ